MISAPLPVLPFSLEAKLAPDTFLLPSVAVSALGLRTSMLPLLGGTETLELLSKELILGARDRLGGGGGGGCMEEMAEVEGSRVWEAKRESRFMDAEEGLRAGGSGGFDGGFMMAGGLVGRFGRGKDVVDSGFVVVGNSYDGDFRDEGGEGLPEL
jgi:hypothetical protein